MTAQAPQDGAASMLAILNRIEQASMADPAVGGALPDDSDLPELVNALRPPDAHLRAQAAANVALLFHILKAHPHLACGLRRYLLAFIVARRQTGLYTDTGIVASDGFFTELFRRISYRLLPPALDDGSLSDCIARILPMHDDPLWVCAVPVADWLALFDCIAEARAVQASPALAPPATLEHGQAGDIATDAVQDIVDASSAPLPGANLTQIAPLMGPEVRVLLGLLEALRTLSYRITAAGLEPSLIRIHPDIETFDSPFLAQNIEVHHFLDIYTRHLASADADAADARHLLVMLAQCDAVIVRIRKRALQLGTSIALTFRLVGLTQNIDRMRKLLAALPPAGGRAGGDDTRGDMRSDPINDVRSDSAAALTAPARDAGPNQSDHRAAAVALAFELLQAHHRKYAVRDLLANNIDLLARNVTENASRTGEHYIAETRAEYRAMFVSSAGAGVVIGFMSLLKILASYLRTAPLVEAFLFSMNYSLGFMLIHVLHFTVATKQPAMTAARIAAGLHSHDGRHLDIDSLVDLIVKVLRTQFVAVLGNLMLALPTAGLIALTYFGLHDHHLVSPDKARHMLHDIDPFGSLAIFYAMIAGVCLFVAGLISGYYDNQALYTRMAQRVTQLRGLRRLLGDDRIARFGRYMEDNLGGLMGNFYFGILLGCIGIFGDMLGLPVDIRHITFSATNFAIAAVGLGPQLTWQMAALACGGVVIIGSVNLLVSFGLALLVALRSRQVRFAHGWTLVKALTRHLCRRPHDFFIAPRDEAAGTPDESGVSR